MLEIEKRQALDYYLPKVREAILHGELDVSVDMSGESDEDIIVFNIEVFGAHKTYDSCIQIYVLVSDIMLSPSFSRKYEGTAEYELQKLVGGCVADVLEAEMPGVRRSIGQIELFKDGEEEADGYESSTCDVNYIA